MKYEVEVTQTAAIEISSIVLYLRDSLHSKQVVNNFLSELDRQIKIISELPETYAVSNLDVIQDFGYRTADVNKYVLLCDFNGKKVTIEHVFHSLQDYGKLI